MRTQHQPSRGLRRGFNFTVRLTPEERAALQDRQRELGGPRALGAWIVWRALGGDPPASRAAWPARVPEQLDLLGARAVPGPGSAASMGHCLAGGALPAPADRLILDLCAGSGSWSAPYEQAGYRVVRVTLPGGDVRTYVPPPGVWGILAAPPCTEFSRAKTSQPRDFIEGMSCVNACLRIVLQAKPVWWALENPAGYLPRFLGPPRDSFEPCEFGDPWTKRTALWGDFTLPRRGPFVQPTGSAMDRSSAAARAVTPPGFARAFFEANP